MRFRRQHPVGRFILDFWCPEARLVVEVDGGIHEHQQEQDAERSAMLKLHDYHVIRFRNDEVLQDRDAVIQRIAAELSARVTPSPAVRERGPGDEGP